MSSADDQSAPRSEGSELDLGVDAAEAKQAEEQTEELLREHDTASRFRTNLGLWAWIVGGLSVALTVFHLYTGIFGSRTSLIQGAIHLGGATSVIYLLYPASKRLSLTNGVPWYDAVLSVLGLGVNLFIVVERSEEHTSELQSRGHLVCRLLLEKKNE